MGNARQVRGTVVGLEPEIITCRVNFGLVRRRVRARRGSEMTDARLNVGDEVVLCVDNLDIRAGVILRMA